MKTKLKITKNRFLIVFIIGTMVLALVRIIFPSIVKKKYNDQVAENEDSINIQIIPQFNKQNAESVNIYRQSNVLSRQSSLFFDADHKIRENKILGVVSYEKSFPDSQNVQLASALRYGVKPVMNRIDAENRKKELVYMAASPYYDVKKLSNSIPYLVPRAAILLQDIGRNFMDSLQIKKIPLNKFLVTSVLRTKEDVEKLRRHNGNATENSCHLHGTTLDIAYNKYSSITRPVRDDTLKWVLSEVLNDLRRQERCYIKYEKHQGCFHVTVR